MALLVKPDIPPVTQLLRGMFNAHFLDDAYRRHYRDGDLRPDRPADLRSCRRTGRGFCDVGARWFLQKWDTELSARDAGDATAVRRLRRLHWVGMLCNAILLIAVIASIPYVSTTAT